MCIVDVSDMCILLMSEVMLLVPVNSLQLTYISFNIQLLNRLCLSHCHSFLLNPKVYALLNGDFGNILMILFISLQFTPAWRKFYAKWTDRERCFVYIVASAIFVRWHPNFCKVTLQSLNICTLVMNSTHMSQQLVQNFMKKVASISHFTHAAQVEI